MIPRSKSNLSKYSTNSKDSLDDKEPELVKLDLSKRNITEFPMNNQLVKSLNASSNRLTQLNKQMVNALLSYQRLKILDLSNNFLTSFPEELKNLHHLESLKLFYNHFRNDKNIKPIFFLPNLKKLDISQNKLTSLPKKFPPKLEVLILDFNMLQKFENVSIPNLTRLSLVLTQLEFISPNMSFQKLTFLDLSRNNLVSLPDLTKFCPNLEVLNLSNNFFPEMPIPPLTIREYIIKSNYILELPNNLSSYINLRSLDVSHNFIEFIPALPPSIISFVFSSNRVKTTTPCKTPNLQRLYLRNNKLTTYPKYEKLQIKEYSGGFNNFTVIKPLFFLEVISRVDFTDNQITEIPSFIYKLLNLTILVLSKNKIRTISNDIIKLKHLQNLNLTENPIEVLPLLPISLETFYAGYCNLKVLPDLKKNINLNTFVVPGNNLGEYPNAPNLKTLDLSRNRFINFPSIQFIEKVFSKMEDLDLSFNFIRQIPSNIHMGQLEELDLSFNSIKSFPDDFQLPKLQFLKLGSNPISLAPARKVTKKTDQQQNRIPVRSNSSSEITSSINLNADLSTEPIQPSLLNSISLENIDGHNAEKNSVDTPNPQKLLPSSSHSCINTAFNLLPNQEKSSNLSSTTSTTQNSDQVNSNSNSTLQDLELHEEVNLMPNVINQFSLNSTNPDLKKSILEEPSSNQAETSTTPKEANSIDSIRHSSNSSPILNSILKEPNSNSIFSLNEKPLSSSLKSPDSKPHNASVKISRTDSLSAASSPKRPQPQLQPQQANRASLDAEKFSKLQIFDITNTGIVFDKEPNIRQFFVSRRLPQYKTRHVKILSSLSWLSFSEMKGVRKTMEDSISLNAFINGDVDLYVICDGHSGHQTSAFSCLFLVDYLANPLNLQKLSRMTVYNSIKNLNNSLHGRRYPDGSTMAMALFNGRKLVTANIGDSRIIVTTKEGKISFETIDHKSTDRMVFERVHQSGGRISQNRIQGILAPGRSLGDYNVLGNTDEPEIKSYTINPDKDLWMIIACDGLFDVLSNQRIAEFSKNARSASELAFDLRNLAFSHMSLDNISVIVVDIQKRFHIEEKILENQCNLDLNDQECINDKDEGIIKEDMLKKIVHIDDENIKDPIPEILQKSAFDEKELNQESNNNENSQISDSEVKTNTTSFADPFDDSNSKAILSPVKNTEQFSSPLKGYPQMIFNEINDDEDDIYKLKKTSFSSETFHKMQSSVSMPSLVPDYQGDTKLKINSNIQKKANDSKFSYRSIDTGSSDDN